MLKYAIVLGLISIARGQNGNAQSQVQQISGPGDAYGAYGQNQAQAMNAQAQVAAAAAAQTMPGMAQGAAYGQVQNPFMGGFYPNQPFVGGGPMVQETRRFLGGYGYGGPAVVGPPVLGPPIYGGGLMGPPVVGVGYGGYYKK